MGRKANAENLEAVLKTIQDHDGRLRANDIAKTLGLHPQAVIRLLTAIEDSPEKWLYEDDRGFLSIFRK